MTITKVNIDDITIGELNSLHPTYGLFKGVNFESVDYYRLDDGSLCEVCVCVDGSMDKRIEDVEKHQKKLELMKDLGF